MNVHEKYMRVAISLAKCAKGLTNPNPIVGAVIVKDGKIVGKGYHKKCGAPHAEASALKAAGPRAKDATLYVTLEPCNHYGRTPPCTDAILKSGIKKVVAAMKDPNPINNGRGFRKLNRHGIKTVTGILEDEAREMNGPYLKFITKRFPFVTIKLAESIDGKIATKTGDSRWITSGDSRRYVHALRAAADAVMVGVNTAVNDDPLLMSKISGAKQPIRIIVDSKLRTPLNARIFSNIKLSPVIIATTVFATAIKVKRFEAKGANVLVARSKNGKVDLKDLLKTLGEMNVIDILVEGGGELASALIEKRLVDRFLFFIAPKIIGGRDAVTSVEGRGVKMIKDAPVLKNVTVKKIADDVLIEGDC